MVGLFLAMKRKALIREIRWTALYLLVQEPGNASDLVVYRALAFNKIFLNNMSSGSAEKVNSALQVSIPPLTWSGIIFFDKILTHTLSCGILIKIDCLNTKEGLYETNKDFSMSLCSGLHGYWNRCGCECAYT